MPRAKTSPSDTANEQSADSGLQRLIAVFAMGLVTTVVSTALFGPDKNSERAFRLMHLWRRKPEAEPAEKPATRAKRR